ncbi:zinc ribbon domain-containing protein [Adlercreutzia equolifaciens]|uniref:zinc ribbon domain-containing protein n=1 Tax=Adlercreutzia equolifaciens TaxID=446660 RepID=UPI00399C4E69
MFCPKCGNQLPDGSAFCGKCGARLGATGAPKASGGGAAVRAQAQRKVAASKAPSARSAASPAGAPASATKVPPLAMAAAVLAAAAVVLSLLPWLEVDAAVSAVSGYAGGFASLLGAGEGSFSFDESYAVWALPSFAGAFGDYASLYGALGGEGAGAASALVGGAAWGCLLLWLAGAVLLVLGAVRIAKSGRKGALVAGGIVMAACAAVLCGLSALLDGIASATAFPLVCLAASIAAAVCALAAKKG